jgi:hypothetical protein
MVSLNAMIGIQHHPPFVVIFDAELLQALQNVNCGRFGVVRFYDMNLHPAQSKEGKILLGRIRIVAGDKKETIISKRARSTV